LKFFQTRKMNFAQTKNDSFIDKSPNIIITYYKNFLL
jgi:hypothetical protein